VASGRVLGNISDARWMLEGIDLCLTFIHGVVTDDVLERGFDVVDGEDFLAWLKRHGATEMTLEGLLVRGWYDFFFAYQDGNAGRPQLSAASGLRTMFRYLFTYKGAFFWKMQAGMGDTVFVPMYEALVKQGVRFEFFSRVTEISCAEAAGALTPSVQRIRIDRQLNLAPGGTPGQGMNAAVWGSDLPAGTSLRRR
jgi:uncharacterized protein with NAD-binding domain and iron-sulfur cluster